MSRKEIENYANLTNHNLSTRELSGVSNITNIIEEILKHAKEYPGIYTHVQSGEALSYMADGIHYDTEKLDRFYEYAMREMKEIQPQTIEQEYTVGRSL